MAAPAARTFDGERGRTGVAQAAESTFTHVSVGEAGSPLGEYGGMADAAIELIVPTVLEQRRLGWGTCGVRLDNWDADRIGHRQRRPPPQRQRASGHEAADGHHGEVPAFVNHRAPVVAGPRRRRTAAAR